MMWIHIYTHIHIYVYIYIYVGVVKVNIKTLLLAFTAPLLITVHKASLTVDNGEYGQLLQSLHVVHNHFM